TRFNCDWSPDVCSAELGVKVSVFFAKCSEVKVKVNRNISSKVKYRYPKKLLKYSNKVFLLRYYTTLHTLTHTHTHTHVHLRQLCVGGTCVRLHQLCVVCACVRLHQLCVMATDVT